MKTYLVASILAFVSAALLTPFVKRVAEKVGAIDLPGDRHIHKAPTPRIGGLAVAFAFAVPLFGLLFWNNDVSAAFFGDRNLLLGLIGASLLTLATGVWDDIKGLGAKPKLTLQALAATLAYLLGFQIETLGNPLTGETIQMGVLSFPVTLLWVVGIMNAVNLLDGIDGLVTGMGAITCATLFVLYASQSDITNALVVASLGGALLGFLIYNFHPASIFLGDTGSLFVGLMLALCSVTGTQKSHTAFTIIVPLIVLALPIADTSLAIFRRVLSGRSLADGDADHIHHRLLKKGLSIRQSVLGLYAICAVLSIASLLTMAFRGPTMVLIAVAGVVAMLALAIRFLGYSDHIREERSRVAVEQLMADIASMRQSLQAVREGIRDAQSVERMAAKLEDGCPILGVESFSLVVSAPNLGLSNSLGAHSLGDPTHCARTVTAECRTANVTVSLTVGWDDGEPGRNHTEVVHPYVEMLASDLLLRIDALELARSRGRSDAPARLT